MGERWPVIICGGGPIGLTLALELEAWRVPVLLLERHRDLSPFQKGRALSIRTMEIYRQLGLEIDAPVFAAKDRLVAGPQKIV